MKRLKLIALIVVLFTTVSYGAVSSYNCASADYPVLVNGQAMTFTDVPPMNYNGRTMLPLRSISEAVGVPINWNNATKSVEINTVDVDKLKGACTMLIASNGETYQQGSGVYVNWDQVLTSYHIVDEGRTQARTAVDKNDLNEMTVITSAPAIDTAILKPSIERKPVKIGDSDDAKAGDRVILICWPDGKETILQTEIKDTSGRITIDAELKSGASGGALFSLDGSLLGMLTSGNDGLRECYVIPINSIRKAI